MVGEGLKIKAFKNRYLSTLIIIILAGYLAFGNWRAIWPIFGASNQLVAALALLVVTIYLFSTRRPTIYTLIPSIFMFATAAVALIYKIIQFVPQKRYLLAFINFILCILAAFMLGEAIRVTKRIKKV